MISLIKKAIIDNIAQMMPLRRYLQKAINSYRTMIALSVIVVVLGLIYIIAADEPSESLFGAGNLEGKGKLVSLYLTAIGGCAVFYGLWLNSRRIGEQTRQNNIADRTNNDKRFGDAIGYLSSDNVGIAIGGIHILDQLARENEYRYKAVVSNIFCAFVNSNSTLYYVNKRYDIIKDILKSLLTGYWGEITLNDATIANLHLKNVSNVRLDWCTILECTFSTISDSIIRCSGIKDTYFHNVISSQFSSNKFENSTFNLGNIDHVLFSYNKTIDQDLKFEGINIKGSQFLCFAKDYFICYFERCKVDDSEFTGNDNSSYLLKFSDCICNKTKFSKIDRSKVSLISDCYGFDF